MIDTVPSDIEQVTAKTIYIIYLDRPTFRNNLRLIVPWISYSRHLAVPAKNCYRSTRHRAAGRRVSVLLDWRVSICVSSLFNSRTESLHVLCFVRSF